MSSAIVFLVVAIGLVYAYRAGGVLLSLEHVGLPVRSSTWVMLFSAIGISGSIILGVGVMLLWHGLWGSRAEGSQTEYVLTDTRLLDEDWRVTIDFLDKAPYAIARYEQLRRDEGQVVDGLADSEAQWSQWLPYEPSAMTITTAPIDFGPYIFAVQSRDPCDAVIRCATSRWIESNPSWSGSRGCPK